MSAIVLAKRNYRTEIVDGLNGSGENAPGAEFGGWTMVGGSDEVKSLYPHK